MLTLLQAQYLFQFPKKNSVHKVGSQSRLGIDVGVKKTREVRLNKSKGHLMMQSEAW